MDGVEPRLQAIVPQSLADGFPPPPPTSSQRIGKNPAVVDPPDAPQKITPPTDYIVFAALPAEAPTRSYVLIFRRFRTKG